MSEAPAPAPVPPAKQDLLAWIADNREAVLGVLILLAGLIVGALFL